MTSPMEDTHLAQELDGLQSKPLTAGQVRGAANWVIGYYGRPERARAYEIDMTGHAVAVLGENLFEEIRSLAALNALPAVQAAVEPPSAPEPAQPRPEAILGDTEQLMRQAIGDPGIWVRRLPGELVTFWAARAVMAALGFDDKRAEVEWGFMIEGDFTEDGEDFVESRDEDQARRSVSYGNERSRTLAQRIIGAPRKVIS